MRPCLSLLLLGAACATTPVAPRDAGQSRAGIAAFNQAMRAATLSMNPEATMALWADDGVSLLPSTKPMIGKKAIDEFLRRVMVQLAGAKMTSFELSCFDSEIGGDDASEWCTEHKRVDLGSGKAPFDGQGQMLLVLRRSPGEK